MNKGSYRSALLLVILAALLGALALRAPSKFSGNSASAPEIEKIKALASTAEQGEELKKLLERVGPEKAQEEMFRSGLPFTGETHLLVHAVGDYVYDQYGPEGVSYCRDYFLSACYHGAIINTLADYGLDGVAEAMEKCRVAPPGVMAQCAHGSGHGFVAWHDYDLLKALRMCEELGAKVAGFGYFNCYDGVFMENFWGVHGGKPSEKRWVKADDLYYPCNDARIPEKYLNGCWANQATLAYQYLKGDIQKTAEFCDTVGNTGYKDTCYNNLYRQIHPLTEGKSDKVFSLCRFATGQDRQEDCLIANMTAYWSVGDRSAPFKICAAAGEALKERCFESLVSLIDYYYAALPQEKALYCDKISLKAYRDACENQSS